jgi:hypothetical protein
VSPFHLASYKGANLIGLLLPFLKLRVSCCMQLQRELLGSAGHSKFSCASLFKIGQNADPLAPRLD